MKKQKKFGRKLKLSKETIVRLDQSDAKHVVGGRSRTCGELTILTYCGQTVCGLHCICEYPNTVWISQYGIVETGDPRYLLYS